MDGELREGGSRNAQHTRPLLALRGCSCRCCGIIHTHVHVLPCADAYAQLGGVDWTGSRGAGACGSATGFPWVRGWRKRLLLDRGPAPPAGVPWEVGSDGL